MYPKSFIFPSQFDSVQLSKISLVSSALEEYYPKMFELELCKKLFHPHKLLSIIMSLRNLCIDHKHLKRTENSYELLICIVKLDLMIDDLTRMQVPAMFEMAAAFKDFRFSLLAISQESYEKHLSLQS